MFEGTCNKLVTSRSFRSRLDRMYLYTAPSDEAHILLDEMEIVGQQEIAEDLWPSDHFGLLSTFTIRDDGEERSESIAGTRKATRTQTDSHAGSKNSPIAIE
jgi:hypothetical protein